MKHGRTLLAQGLHDLGLPSDADSPVFRNLIRYGELLADYREANVIGVQDIDEILIEHILDSLTCMQAVDMSRVESAADIGSGAGLPGIPLAIANPHTNFVLVDSVGKKSRFQELARDRLGLSNVEVKRVRIEDFGREPTGRAAFDLVVSRALAPLNLLSEYCLPLLRGGGVVLSMKGKLQPEELETGARAASLLGGGAPEVQQVKRLEGQVRKDRSLVKITKVGRTPELYPRAVGVPKKDPLGSVTG